MLKEMNHLAKNPPSGDGRRHRQVTDRSQTFNPHNDRRTKRDSESGRFIDQKADSKPFKALLPPRGPI